MIATAPDLLDDIRETIARHLEDRRARLCTEVSEYPMPIPACDVHFNRLLEERAEIFADLARVSAMQNPSVPALRSVVQSSRNIDPDTRRHIESRLHEMNR